MNFSHRLIEWYHLNKRDLPWRKTTNPYYIWLSEIILQQTRVTQGLPYYLDFIHHYPKIDLLAKANEEDVLKLWQGLGYYSRARNLHYTAKFITKELDGKFPSEYTEILNLKGVGEYTAAAISSFAYNQVQPVIDGNVYRVLARIFGVKEAIDSTNGKKTFKILAKELIDTKNPSTYNQAIMEFGALQCIPANPNCEECPFIQNCYAYSSKTINELPFKPKKIKQRNRYFNYLVIHYNNSIYFNKREKNDIWKGLFDFPLIESDQEIKEFPKLLNKEWTERLKESGLVIKNRSIEHKHILSHQKIHAIFWKFDINTPLSNEKNIKKISINKIDKHPIPKLIENYLKSIL